MIDELEVVERVFSADGVLVKHATGRPGQLLLTFGFDGDERAGPVGTILADHELLRVTVERVRYADVDGDGGDVIDLWGRIGADED